MTQVVEYFPTFPAELIERLVDQGIAVNVQYVGPNMANPYRISIHEYQPGYYKVTQ